MSSALLSNLPRFDQGDHTHPAEQLRRMLGQMQAAAARPAAEAEPQVMVSEEEEELTTPVDTGPPLAEVERLIGQLSAALNQIESEARDQSVRVTQALASRLFPELSRRFLADELAGHLPKLIPASVPTLEIRAQQEMLDKLDPVMARETSLAGRVTLMPATSADDTRVVVSWKTGGVTFDFEGLLAACLAHLDPSQTMIEE
jgi:hypothetical protein